MEKTYSEFEQEKRIAEDAAIKAQSNASNATLDVDHHVNSNILHLKVISDTHDLSQNELENLVYQAARLGIKIFFNGDLGEFNVHTVDTVSHYNTVSPEDEIKRITQAIKNGCERADYLPKDVIIGWCDGNHEDKITRQTSVCVGARVMEYLGIPERFARYKMKVNFHMVNPTTKEIEKNSIVFGHGSDIRAGNAGKSIDSLFAKNPIKGVNGAVFAHTHEVSFANTKVSVHKSNGSDLTMPFVMFNSGSYKSTVPNVEADYAAKAGYTPTARADGEILRISVEPIEDDKKCKFCIDMINQRDLLDTQTRISLLRAKKMLNELENVEYKNYQALDRAYKAAFKKMGELVKNGRAIKEPSKLSSVSFMPWSGFAYGAPVRAQNNSERNQKGVAKENKIKKAIDVASKLYHVGIVLSDAIYYKDIKEFSGTKEVSAEENAAKDILTKIQILAEDLMPVADKIIAYNYGTYESKIMKHYGRELAKLAMNTLQMDEKLVYQPYNKLEYRAEVKKHQNDEVLNYNKTMLQAECARYATSKKLMLEYNEYVANTYGNEKIDEDDVFKKYVSSKLREQNKLIDSTNKDLVDSMFPPESFDLKEPNENLIANMLFSCLKLKNIKNIEVNPNPNTQTQNSLKLVNEKNSNSPLEVTGSYSTSVALRSAQTNNMKKTSSYNIGYDVVYVTPKKNAEFITKGLSVYYDDNKTIMKPTYYISAANFDSTTYIDRIESEPKIYIFKRVLKTPEMKEEETGKRSMYQTDGDFTLIAKSVSYDTALVDDDIRADVLLNMVSKSHQKALNSLIKRQNEKVVINAEVMLNNEVDKYMKMVDNSVVKYKNVNKPVVKKVEETQTADTKVVENIQNNDNNDSKKAM